MGKFKPLYTLAHTPSETIGITYALNNRSYFNVSFFYVLLYNRSRKYNFPVFPYVIEILMEAWDFF